MLENWLRDEAQVTLQKTAAAQFREEAKKLDPVIKLGSRIVEKSTAHSRSFDKWDVEKTALKPTVVMSQGDLALRQLGGRARGEETKKLLSALSLEAPSGTTRSTIKSMRRGFERAFRRGEVR